MLVKKPEKSGPRFGKPPAAGPKKTENLALWVKAMNHAKKRASIEALKDCTTRIAASSGRQARRRWLRRRTLRLVLALS